MVKFTIEHKEFNKALKKFIKQSDIAAGKVVRKVAFDLLGTIIGGLPGKGDFNLKSEKGTYRSGPKTYNFKNPTRFITGRHPVDTGRARAGWHASMKGLQPTMADRFNWSKGVKTKNAAAIEKGKGEGKFVDGSKKRNPYVELINNVPYIINLEYGSSRQAPAGMIRIAMRSWRGALSEVMGNEFLAEWNSFDF
jgi:hypothetical protein